MKKLGVLSFLLFWGACTVGPNYHRPSVNLPGNYRGATAPAAKPSLGSEKWWQVFRDPTLVKLIHTAMAQNYDVRIAAARVVEAQAAVGITRASQFPSVAFGGALFTEQNPKISKIFPAYQVNAGRLDFSVLWNLDFWGKYRRETEAVRAQLLSTEWGQRAVRVSIVASVATAYLQLQALDADLSVARRALASREASLRLIRVLARNGSTSALDVSQARQLVDVAAEEIPNLERQIAEQENLLRLLLGENPGPIPRARPLLQQPEPATVPAGLPAELLDRRPDIAEAEANLMAANAQIGVLKASLFPDISLTGTGGVESYALNRLISRPSRTWNIPLNLVQPVFEAGALRSGVRLAQAQWRQMLLTYRQSILTALDQVSNTLIAYQKDREFLQRQQQLTEATRQSDRLSLVLYRNGGASYLQVLTSETNFLAAQFNLIQAELNARLALVQLYQALGGGWQS
jgi:multidrug efflux system outer membrane protein